MTPHLVYCCPVEANRPTNSPENSQILERFVSTFLQHPPEHRYELIVVSNGGPPSPATQALLAPLAPRFIEHNNEGKDIGAYQFAAGQLRGELAVFFGASAYFKRPGWLVRMVDSFRKHGDTLYGAMGNQGDDAAKVWPHIRTNGFWLSPRLMNLYPISVTRDDQRYEFEHGKTGLTSWILNQGKRVWVVSFDGECHLSMCDLIPNGFHRGDQSNLLVGDRLSCPPYYHCP